MPLAQQLEQLISLGIFVAGGALTALSYVAWRRERIRRMGIVTVAYALFASYGLIVFLETLLLSSVGYPLEVIEHASAILVLFGLLAFFVAMTRE